MNWKSVTINGQAVKSLAIGGAVIWQKSRLPEGYTEVEYLQSDGAQVINADVASYCRAQLDVRFLPTGRFHYMGVGANPPNCFGCDAQNQLSLGSTYALPGLDATQRHTVVFDLYEGGSTLTAEGLSVSREGSIVIQRFGLFGTAGYLAYSQCCCQLYGAQLYKGDVLKQDLVPCVSPSGEAGLYDLVTGKFFGNSGTGAFTTGPVV